jgi:predicted porin
LQHTSKTPEIFKTYVWNTLFQCKHLLAISQMEAHQGVEVTGVLASGPKLAGNAELGSDARKGWVGGMWRSLVSSSAMRRWVAMRIGLDGSSTSGGGIEGKWRREWEQCPDVGHSD